MGRSDNSVAGVDDDAMTAEPVHRTIVVLDIVEFAHPQRTDPTRLRLRHQLYKLVRQTLIAAGINPEHAPRVDLGDGVIVLFEPDLSAVQLVDVVIPHLGASLAEVNRQGPGDERLRLRIALHRGDVLIDAHGFVGSALVEACRLSNAAALREQLAATSADMALIVSDQVWRQLPGPHTDPRGPSRYHPVAFTTHDVTTRAWVHVPEHRTRAGAIATPPVPQPVMAPVYRSIFAVDIQGSTTAARTDPVKERLRQELYRLLHQALAGAGVKEQHRDPSSDRGDGFLLLLHPVDDLPKTQLLGSLVSELTAGLAAYNRGVPPAEQLLLRAALHAGEVHHDPNGPFGNPIDVTFRLLEARRFRTYRRQSGAPLVLIVSGDIYRSVVWHSYPGIDRDTYQRLLRIRVAGRLHDGWVHTPAVPDD
jgi:class 3 adenylate cyclase